nr:hypothetical protein [Micromonospora endolithica]
MSAPPVPFGEARRETDGDRLVVPAQRPAPDAEQQPGPVAGPESGPTRHASDDRPSRPRWADSGPPTSAPPAMHVPPVGTAASGFEVPPGFHAPTVDRAAAQSPAGGEARWDDPYAVPPAVAYRSAPDNRTYASPGDRPDRAPVPDRPDAGRDQGDRPPTAQDPGDRPTAGRAVRDREADGRPSPVRALGAELPPAERAAGADLPPTERPVERGWAPVDRPLADQPFPPDLDRVGATDRAAGRRAFAADADRAGAAGRPFATDADRAGAADRAAGRPFATDADGAGAADAGRAGTADRARGPEPTAADPPGVSDRSGPERPGPERPGPDRPRSERSGSERSTAGRPATERGRAWSDGSDERDHPRYAGIRDAGADRPTGPVADERPGITEPDWSGPNWNRPSWGSPWAPPWARDEIALSGHDEAEPAGHGTRPDPGFTEGGARPDRRPTWAGEPDRPYDPSRAEPDRRYPTQPYEPVRAGSAARPTYEPPAAPTDRPAWALGRPASAPPAPSAPEVPPPGPEPVAGEPNSGAVRPFRLRPVSAAPAAETSTEPPSPTGPAITPATSGAARRDRTPFAPVPTSAPPYAARRSAPDPVPTAEPADGDGLPDDTSAVLPQRVPAEPDVPVVPEPPAVEPPAETPELARIAKHLRREDEPAPLRERPEGFDVDAILTAVRGVDGVRDAELRRTPAGAHSLRLDLSDGADPAEVSRQVARLLQERMGLAAAPRDLSGPPTAPVRRRSAEPQGAEARSVTTRDLAAPSAPGSRAPGGRPETLPARAEPRDPAPAEAPRRRRQYTNPPHRGRASVEEPGSVSTAPLGTPPGSPVTLGTSYSGGQVTTTETAPSRPLDTGGAPGPRVVIDHVQVSTFGLDATVEVRLMAGARAAAGHSTGPAVDGYVLRLCAVAAAAAVDELLRGAEPESGRCFVEHAAVVPFGNCEVATVVVLLICDGWVEQLAGSALVAGDPRQAVVRATLAAINRRLEALLA